jgi:glycosyltransferase involved in cell wall biosynthesis
MVNDSRIHFFRQPENYGPIFNFQFVLEKAVGEYFIWVSDDDWHAPEFVESLLEAINSDDSAVMAFCDFDVRTEDGAPALGYADSHNALRLMTRKTALERQFRFFMLAEGRAIPHAVYGLYPMKFLRGFSWGDHVREYGEYGADTIFVFGLLGQGRLALVERKLFATTVNNLKYYNPIKRNSLLSKGRTVVHRFVYLFSFIKISQGLTRTVLICVIPLKLAEMFFSIFVREPLLKVIRKASS